MSIFDRLYGMRKKVMAGAIAAATLVAGLGLTAPAYAADFQLVGPDTVPSSDKFQITALGLPSDVATDDIKWETSQWRNAMQSMWPQDQGNTSTWDADISPYEDGSVTISATYQGQTAEKTVKVEKKPYVYLAGFELTGDGLDGSDGEYTLNLPAGGTVETSVAFTPADATYQHLVWQTLDPSVVRAGADGVIRAVGNGSTDLIAYSYGRVHKKTIHVTVSGSGPVNVPVESVALDKTAVSLKEGETHKLNATVSPANATNKKVSWSSSNASVASVDANGTVTAVAKGTATITASAEGKTATAAVTVTKEDDPTPPVGGDVTGVSINGGNVEMSVNSTKKLSFTVTPANAIAKNVEWVSVNEAVASVDTEGNVTAKSAGTAEIFVFVDGYMDQITVTVKNSAPVELQSIAISGSGIVDGEMAMQVNDSKEFTAVPTPSNASVAGAAWSSLDDSVATVDGNGKVTAKSEGLTMIMVELGGHSDSVLLTVSGKVDPPTPGDSRFSDVPKSHHFYADIEWLASSGVTTGFGDGTFRPSEETSRAQTVVFLHRLAVQRGDREAASYSPSAADYARFPDVDRDSFGAKQILWAASKGITTGRADGSFGGDVAVTRDQMVTFLCRFAAVEGDAGAKSFAPSAADYARFSDVGRGTFAAREILWGASVGIVNGKDGKFSGGDSTLREQMAAFLHRLNTHLG